MKVLLLEPDASQARTIEFMLASQGFSTYTTDLGEEGVDVAKRCGYDIMLLELVLPDMSGHDVIRTLRANKVDLPIMPVTGTSTIENKVKALRVGADDYLTKPFHKDELVARMHALVRRASRVMQSVVAIGPLSIDLENRYVTAGGDMVRLSAQEFDVLELLVRRMNRLVTKDQIMDHLYGTRVDEPEEKIVSVIICKLKKRLAEVGFGRDAIACVWGKGYRLDHTDVLRPSPSTHH